MNITKIELLKKGLVSITFKTWYGVTKIKECVLVRGGLYPYWVYRTSGEYVGNTLDKLIQAEINLINRGLPC